tara:strand:- start:1439 stop:1642 length:204 start_codon:yes stop_codon:yes gene_type:complete
MTKDKKTIAIIGSVFLVEALIHYNIGVNKGKETFKLELPPTKEFLKIAGVVLVFSVLTEKIIKEYVR